LQTPLSSTLGIVCKSVQYSQPDLVVLLPHHCPKRQKAHFLKTVKENCQIFYEKFALQVEPENVRVPFVRIIFIKPKIGRIFCDWRHVGEKNAPMHYNFGLFAQMVTSVMVVWKINRNSK